MQTSDHHACCVQMATHEGVIGYLDNYELITYWNMFIHRGNYGSGILFGNATKTVVLNTSSPIVRENGVARCAHTYAHTAFQHVLCSGAARWRCTR